jgi:hypothetical protein
MSNKIPNELRVDLVDDGQGSSQWVETRVIQPVAGQSQSQVRFLLPQEGILDSAFVSFQVKAASNNERLPLWAGAMSAFDSATLMIGGETVAQSRGVSHLWTLKNFYRDPQTRDHKMSKRVGSQTSMMVDKLTGDAAADVGCWGCDVNADDISAPTAGTRITNQGYRITNDLATTPTWEVKLADLFPILYQNNLPLFALKDQCSIVFNLTEEQTRGDRACCADGLWVAGTTYENWKLHIDLCFYEDDDISGETTFDKLRARLNGGLRLNFTDYTYVLQQQDAAAPATANQQVNTLLGLDNQVVRKIFIATPEAPDYANAQNSGNALLGNYHSLGSNLQNTLQVTINSEPYFPNALNTDGKIQNQLSQAMPMPHKINQAAQSAVGQVNPVTGAYVAAQQQLTDKTLNGMSQQLQQGCGHYYGIPLSKSFANAPMQGTPVGRQSVLLEMRDQRCATGNAAKQVHLWAECERQMLMAQGKVLVTGA